MFWSVAVLEFLPRDATQSAVMPQYIVCPPVCPSAICKLVGPLGLDLLSAFRYRDHIGWNTSKIITRPNSVRPLLGLTPTWAI